MLCNSHVNARLLLCIVYSCRCLLVFFLFFFFKQKTAYEMRISDWSSDVCSSDLDDDPDQYLQQHRDDADQRVKRVHPAAAPLKFVPDLAVYDPADNHRRQWFNPLRAPACPRPGG